QPRGARPPLFCVHPGGGTAFCYASLTGYLGEEQPLYGLQAVGSHGEEAPLTRVEEMAARYIAEMRTVQSRGPYRLCGWSFGGIIAFEMGRQLCEQGEEVAPLFLIDSCAPALFSDEPLDEVEFIQTMATVWRASIPETMVEELRQLDPPQRPHRFVEAAREMQAWPSGFDPARIEGLWEVYRANMQAGSRYDPSPWPATIRLLCAEPGEALESPPTLGWDTLAATVDTRSVPGKHEVLLDEPCVRHVAEHLSAWIKEVESEA
ncbi:MAG TPA: alpha/beta fold hydrolase, partial [Myxococcota bacterium]|nr:alpha/beta fold hydrolase [Myxococcota bacterium]